MRFNVSFVFLAGIFYFGLTDVFCGHEPNNSETDKILRVVKENSEAVVLIYTFDDSAAKDNKIYNSAIKPRLRKGDYSVGVANGVVVSENGIIVVPYDAIKNSSEIIVSVNSELREYQEGEKIKFTENDYKAEIIKSFPARNLAFLKIKPKRKLKFIQLGLDADFVNNPKKIINKTLGIVGKAKAKEFATLSKPGTTSNNFDVFLSYSNKIEFRKFSGIPRLVARDLNAGNAFIPETSGGPLLDTDGNLVGIVFFNYQDFPIPIECAIPVFELKDCLKAAGISIPYLLDENFENIGIEASDIKTPLRLKDADLKAFKIEKSGNETFGIKIKSVVKGSKAKSAGLKPGDVILSLNDEVVTDVKTFKNLITRVSGNIILKIFDDKKIREIEIK